MVSGRNDGKGPPPADEGDRGLLFGLSEDGEDAGESPGTPPGVDDPAPAIVAALAEIHAGQDRLEAALAALDAKLPADRGSGPGLAEGVTKIVEAAGRIARAAEFVAEIERTTGEAARFTNDTKEATGVLQAEAGKQIAGLKEGRRDLEKAVAELGSRAEGLKAREDALGKGIGELRALWKSVNERSGALASEARTLAKNYESWRAEAATHRQEMAALSRDLREGGARMEESVAKNAEGQLEISVKTLGNVRNFKDQNDRFMERFEAGGQALLETVRSEWTAAQRWAVPALAAALVLAVPSFVAVGAYAQSEFGFFSTFERKDAIERMLWRQYGHHVSSCSLTAQVRQRTVKCSFDVGG